MDQLASQLALRALTLLNMDQQTPSKSNLVPLPVWPPPLVKTFQRAPSISKSSVISSAATVSS